MDKKYRVLYIALMITWDFVSVLLSVILGFRLRYSFKGDLPAIYSQNIAFYVLFAFVIVLISNLIFNAYNSVWKYASTVEVVKQIKCVILDFILLAIFANFIEWDTPLEVILLICALIFLMSLLGRMSVRAMIYFKARLTVMQKKNEMKRVLIYGAGQAGSHLSKRLIDNPQDGLLPIGFLDDKESLWDCKVNGLPVMGGKADFENIVRLERIDEVIVAIPTASTDFLKDLLVKCQSEGCSLRRYGSIDDVSIDDFSKLQIKSIKLDELLRRDSVHLNMKIVKSFIENKTIVVTGGVGSIGSEICRQVLNFGAEKLIIFDIDENGLFDIDVELKKNFDPSKYDLCLGSIRDNGRLDEVFQKYKPQVVFHAAAHKHVPMMELNPKEAIKNNVFGTINVAKASIKNNVDKFILISTDKAVNPTSIMGASKRIAELAVQALNRSGCTDFAAVRFGNVLGSNGSVVPFFQKQIESGGPVTVTHPDMRRYFMTIPEAVQLVLEAGAMASGGEIFVLDMGEPVKIYDLATDLIRLSGYEPEKDIKIIYTGLRPGEKLFEEISLKSEDVTKTPNNKIYICKPTSDESRDISDKLHKLETELETDDQHSIFGLVKCLVPSFDHEI